MKAHPTNEDSTWVPPSKPAVLPRRSWDASRPNDVLISSCTSNDSDYRSKDSSSPQESHAESVISSDSGYHSNTSSSPQASKPLTIPSFKEFHERHRQTTSPKQKDELLLRERYSLNVNNNLRLPPTRRRSNAETERYAYNYPQSQRERLPITGHGPENVYMYDLAEATEYSRQVRTQHSQQSSQRTILGCHDGPCMVVPYQREWPNFRKPKDYPIGTGFGRSKVTDTMSYAPPNPFLVNSRSSPTLYLPPVISSRRLHNPFAPRAASTGPDSRALYDSSHISGATSNRVYFHPGGHAIRYYDDMYHPYAGIYPPLGPQNEHPKCLVERRRDRPDSRGRGRTRVQEIVLWQISSNTESPACRPNEDRETISFRPQSMTRHRRKSSLYETQVVVEPSPSPSSCERLPFPTSTSSRKKSRGPAANIKTNGEVLKDSPAFKFKKVVKRLRPTLHATKSPSLRKDRNDTYPETADAFVESVETKPRNHSSKRAPAFDQSYRTIPSDTDDTVTEGGADSDDGGLAPEDSVSDCTISQPTQTLPEDTEGLLGRAVIQVKELLLHGLFGHALSDVTDGLNESSQKRGRRPSSTSSSQLSDHPPRKRVRGGGRDPGGGGDDSDADEDEGDRPNRNGKSPPFGLPNRRLKCPFYQRQPEKHSRAACRGEGFADMAKLKDHIKRAHTQPLRCPRCWKQMKSDDACLAHLQAEKICKNLPEPQDDRIHLHQLKNLDFKKAPFAQAKNSEEKWKMLYSALFPTDTIIPSPYDQHSFTPRLENALYKALEDEVTRELAPALEPILRRIKERIPAIIQNCKMNFMRMSPDSESTTTPNSPVTFNSIDAICTPTPCLEQKPAFERPIKGKRERMLRYGISPSASSSDDIQNFRLASSRESVFGAWVTSLSAEQEMPGVYVNPDQPPRAIEHDTSHWVTDFLDFSESVSDPHPGEPILGKLLPDITSTSHISANDNKPLQSPSTSNLASPVNFTKTSNIPTELNPLMTHTITGLPPTPPQQQQQQQRNGKAGGAEESLQVIFDENDINLDYFTRYFG